jgi:hypothetical protein
LVIVGGGSPAWSLTEQAHTRRAARFTPQSVRYRGVPFAQAQEDEGVARLGLRRER